MRDPRERRSEAGTIVTGASAARIPPAFRDLLDAACSEIGASYPGVSTYVYGSVANGQAVAGRSDVDLLAIGLSSEEAAAIGAELSDRFVELTRRVEVGAARQSAFVGDDDEAYGNRAFLRHYCVWLAGPVDLRPSRDVPADRRAARGFNGDVARHRDRWIRDLATVTPADLATRVARKTLLAVAGLVSVHDRTWTTDRTAAAERWSRVEPGLTDDLTTLIAWAEHPSAAAAEATVGEVREMLSTGVAAIVDRFAADIGLWPEP